MTVLHIEQPSEQLCRQLIDIIDAQLGLPNTVASPLGEVARCWLRTGRQGRMPDHGLILTWAYPLRHPTQTLRWSVVVTTEALDLMPQLVAGQVPIGLPQRPIEFSDAVERTEDWVPELASPLGPLPLPPPAPLPPLDFDL